MSIFTFHLVETSFASVLKTLMFPPKNEEIKGLIHAEYMQGMTLGSPIFSTKRILFRQLVVFAQWENESAIDEFLKSHQTGKLLSNGWHIRMNYLRQWGKIDKFQIPESTSEMDKPENPVVAVTIARMRLSQVPRFIRWGRPVEKLVRDDPNTSISLAATRLPRTVSTFSIWNAQKNMLKMVHGHGVVENPTRHAEAMRERERKDFHWQFTTLRFKPISEYGSWKGKSDYIPNQSK
ncbi:MAG: hypothetical protein EP338_07905 [Bacteroidetes bacterium]|nr:MAG: hypothetical protein EP338_07905 [Bacteroidota bacterium]